MLRSFLFEKRPIGFVQEKSVTWLFRLKDACNLKENRKYNEIEKYRKIQIWM